jgi:tetratricopeptide (TPR) repeat protein
VTRSSLWPIVAVATIAGLAHVTSLAGGFVWLDHAHLQDALATAPPAGWPSLFTHGFAGTGFYRPLMALSLSIDAALGGAPWLFHATTLAWHAAAAVMVVLAGEALGVAWKSARLAGALFAVHPATSLVAGAIAFRSEAMLAVALLALIVFHRAGRAGPAALALLAGALTKETGLALAPLVIAALALESRPAGVAPAGQRRWRLFAAEGAAFALALALRLAFAPGWRASTFPLNAGDAIGTRLAGLAKSAWFLLVPWDRSLCDAFAIAPFRGGRAFAGLVVLVALALWAHRRRGPALLLGLALLPALNLVPLMRWWSPHYLYLPLAFAAMLAAEWATQFGRHGLAVATAVGALWAGLSMQDGRRFISDETLWTPELAAQPACREAHFYLGDVAYERHHLEVAADHYERAIVATPGIISYVDRGAALQNLAVVRMKQARPNEARVAIHAALALVTGDRARRRLTHNLAAVELRAGDAGEAARLLEPEVARADAQAESIFLRARALHQLGREDEARGLLRMLPPRPGLSAPPR